MAGYTAHVWKDIEPIIDPDPFSNRVRFLQ